MELLQAEEWHDSVCILERSLVTGGSEDTSDSEGVRLEAITVQATDVYWAPV